MEEYRLLFMHVSAAVNIHVFLGMKFEFKK